MNAESLLWSWCREGWRYREIGRQPRAAQNWYEDRIRYEMNLIIDKDLVPWL